MRRKNKREGDRGCTWEGERRREEERRGEEMER